MKTTPARSRMVTFVGLCLGLGLGLGLPADSAEALASPPPGELGPDEEPEPEPPPTWRFRDADRPVKVMILAGSVGAWQRDPYHKHFEDWCSAVEVKNLSMTGYGAYQLRMRFMDQVVANGYVNLRAPESEYWLVFQGGLNSVATPEKTNREIRQLFMSAHQRGVKVVALSLSPWGDETDTRRWKGIAGLDYKRDTQIVVDYELGRSSPGEALGRYVDRRDDPSAPWDPSELADVGINLYDSPLRNAAAPLRDVAKMRKELDKSSTWKKRFAGLDPSTRELALAEQAQRAAELPQWFMRKEFHSFDHIHPNEFGHRLLAEIACPDLPESWSCECPAIGSGPQPPAQP